MDGFLVIDKPRGPTSFDVVRTAREVLGEPRVGHTGTLDPMATGVLPLCLGEATKVAQFVAEREKAYDAVVQLGVVTDTLDLEGRVLARQAVPPIDREGLERVLGKFRGSGFQTPPMFSAVKVAGKRLYESARRGEEVAREPRPVTVHELVLRDYSREEVAFFVRCSKGFFVRVLADELGRELGCGGCLKALSRTQSGPFRLADAVSLDTLVKASGREAARAVAERALVSAADALADLPALRVSQREALRVIHGQPLEDQEGEGRVRILGPDGRLLAVAEISANKRVRYLRVLGVRGV